jgi:hypothetical protein
MRKFPVTHLLLAALLFRAYIPVGFMPASGTPFLLEMCPVASSSEMPAHHGHQHTGGHSHFENCPFGSAPGAAPVTHVIAFELPSQSLSPCLVLTAPSPPSARPERAHPPRGPPALA